jgi:hypothetical protein
MLYCLLGAIHYETQRKKAGAHLFFNAFWLILHFCINLMYMRDTMHQIDSVVIISFLKAILRVRKFRECVELPLGIAGAAAKKLTSILRKLLGKETSASWHIMHGAHACLVPVNYHTTNVFKQLAEEKKAARHTRACDYRHLLLLLPFILSNLFRDEVATNNSHHQYAPIVDPSEVLIGISNLFLRWYKMFWMSWPGKTPADIGTLRALCLRYIIIIYVIRVMYII